jgi:hypothetical protein
MIETVGEMQEALKNLDPNLRLLIDVEDPTVKFFGEKLVVEEIHQVSADFVKIRTGWQG